MQRPRRGKRNRSTGRTTAGNQRHLRLVSPRQRCTLLDLIQKLQDSQHGDDEVVATIMRLIETGRVVLSHAFSGDTAGSVASSKSANGRTARPSRIRFAR